MEVLLRGATVFDGSGTPGRQADVAVHGDRIVAVGPDAEGAVSSPRRIDVGGLALAPGFIDLHSHADHTLPAFPAAPNNISQGVTTELVGLCGFSPAPVSPIPERAAQLRELGRGIGPGLDWSWSDFASFLDRLEASGPFSFDVDSLPAPFGGPTLILTARQDHLCGYQDAWDLLDNYPRATFAVLDRAGHFVNIEQDALCRALMCEWLDRVEEGATV